MNCDPMQRRRYVPRRKRRKTIGMEVHPLKVVKTLKGSGFNDADPAEGEVQLLQEEELVEGLGGN